jgi:hypothetical protein
MSHAVHADVNSGKYTCGIFWNGVRLSSLDMSATTWSIVPIPGDIWVWSRRWNENWQGKPKYSEITCPSTTLPIKHPTWPDLESTPGRNGGKWATNGLSYGTASRMGILPPYCLHTPMECPLWLSCWVQIRALSTISLNWSIRTSLLSRLERNLRIIHKLSHSPG